MEQEKKRLIKEIIFDIIYVIIMIIGTIFAVMYIFPNISDVDVMSSHDYICSDLSLCNCSSEENKCVCKYCKEDNCIEVFEEVCE